MHRKVRPFLGKPRHDGLSCKQPDLIPCWCCVFRAIQKSLETAAGKKLFSKCSSAVHSWRHVRGFSTEMGLFYTLTEVVSRTSEKFPCCIEVFQRNELCNQVPLPHCPRTFSLLRDYNFYPLDVWAGNTSGLQPLFIFPSFWQGNSRWWLWARLWQNILYTKPSAALLF